MIRKIARPMLASVFIADGVDTLRNQDDHVEGARNVLDRARTVTPNQYAGYLPADPRMVVRVAGGTKVVAGSLYALGKAPRLSATALALVQLPTAVARHAFWETQDAEEKKNRRTGFITDLGLLGGLFLATADTAGKPGLAWRANHATKQVNKKVQAALPTKSEAEKRRAELQERASEIGEAAKERAGILGEAARERADEARAYVDDNKDDWKESLVSFAGDARDAAVTIAGDAREKLAEAAGTVSGAIDDIDADAVKKDLRTSATKNRRAARRARKRIAKDLRKNVTGARRQLTSLA